MQSKLIEYAYPSSTTATKAGYGDKGCWFVALYKDFNSVKRVKYVSFHATKDEASTAAEALPNPYNFMHKYFIQ